MSIDPEGFQPLPLRDERTAAMRAEAETLLAQANKLHAEANGKAERIVADARTEGDRIRAAAQAETAERKRRDDKLDTWAARGVIAGAVGLTASGEYSLARMAGFDPGVAWLLPFVIDVYVIQAFRRHRDIVQAIALTIAANVSYHLADAGLFGVESVGKDSKPTWWLIALVASVASLILWRMHLMVRPEKPAKVRQKQQPSDRQETAPPSTPPPTRSPAVDDSSDKTAADNARQEATTGAANNRQNDTAKKTSTGAKKPVRPRRQPAAKKPATKRRSMDDWVTDAGPVFHAEFTRLRRNPTAAEFATAIQKAGLGKVSDSTAKNIRAEILDRTPLPELDGTE